MKNRTGVDKSPTKAWPLHFALGTSTRQVSGSVASSSFKAGYRRPRTIRAVISRCCMLHTQRDLQRFSVDTQE